MLPVGPHYADGATLDHQRNVGEDAGSKGLYPVVGWLEAELLGHRALAIPKDSLLGEISVGYRPSLWPDRYPDRVERLGDPNARDRLQPLPLGVCEEDIDAIQREDSLGGLQEGVQSLREPEGLLHLEARAVECLPHLLNALVVGGIPHYTAQLHRPIILDRLRDQIPQPHDAAVGRHHPILKLVSPPLSGRIDAKLDRPFSIIGMDMVLPKGRLRKPALEGVTEDFLGLFAHEGELEGPGVRLPVHL